MRLYFAALSVALISAPALSEPKIDVQGLILGSEGARYVKGVPTLDLEQQLGAVQIRFSRWDHDKAVFAIAFFNAGFEPVNIGLEDLHASANGTPLAIYTVDELTRQAKGRATWRSIGLALLGGLGAAAAASRRDTYSGHVTGPYGTAYYSGSYPSLAGQLQANQISADTRYGIAAIRAQLDATIAMIDDRVVQRTTVDPGQSYAGLIVVQKMNYGKTPIDFRLDVDWNGERYPFGYVLVKKGQAVPALYADRLASKAKPMVLVDRTTMASAPSRTPTGPFAARPAMMAKPRLPEGTILLASGAAKVPAKTASGYCLKTPPGYVGAGSLNYPSITGALPRCPE